MPLHYYSEYSAKDSSLTPGWHRGNEDVVFSNPKFGCILHVGISNGKGDLVYDQPAWAEPIGAIIIPVDQSGNIAFIENFRNVPPKEYQNSSYPPSDLSQHGCFSLELPRGFAELGESSKEAARREAVEETGYQVHREPIFLGINNTNTTFFLQNIPIWLVRIFKNQNYSDFTDPHEVIRKVCFLSLEEAMNQVKSGKIICGITKSALLHYFIWVHEQNNSY